VLLGLPVPLNYFSWEEFPLIFRVGFQNFLPRNGIQGSAQDCWSAYIFSTKFKQIMTFYIIS
jgi:hypothetical protein